MGRKHVTDLEVDGPVRDESQKDRQDFQQRFHFLYFLLRESPSVRHLRSVQQTRLWPARWSGGKKKPLCDF